MTGSVSFPPCRDLCPQRQARRPDLHVDLGGYQIAAFFWEAENIEFTVFPELIDTEQRYQALMAFLVELATVTGKPAILTTETTQPRGLRPWFVTNPGDTQPTFNP